VIKVTLAILGKGSISRKRVERVGWGFGIVLNEIGKTTEVVQE